jgi:hypothetical protein
MCVSAHRHLMDPESLHGTLSQALDGLIDPAVKELLPPLDLPHQAPGHPPSSSADRHSKLR